MLDIVSFRTVCICICDIKFAAIDVKQRVYISVNRDEITVKLDLFLKQNFLSSHIF